MTKPLCKGKDGTKPCSKPARAKGWCWAHYARSRRDGLAADAPLVRVARPTLCVRVDPQTLELLRAAAQVGGLPTATVAGQWLDAEAKHRVFMHRNRAAGPKARPPANT